MSGPAGDTAARAEVTELDSGLEVVTEQVPSVRSIALGLWVRTGSRDEDPGRAGVSHFLEHLLFKGTDRHSAVELSELFDGLGAAVNAATGKETTNLHARFLDRHLDEAFEAMGEMLLHPAYPEVDSERQVVAEEIAMYEDEPSDRVHDHLTEAIFGDEPLGRRVIGDAEVIRSIPVPEIAAYHDRRYLPGRMVVSAAGNVDHGALVEAARRSMRFPAGDGGQGPGTEAAGNGPTGRPAGPAVRFQQKDTEQYHICFGAEGISRGDERRYALAVLDSILGGSTSSRLFREIREERGLAYAVASFSESYSDTGIVGAYVGTREENVEEACSVIGDELARIASEPVSAEELERATEHVKGRLVLTFESTGPRMSRNARAALLGLPLETLDEMIEAVDAVGLEDVRELAASLYDPAGLSAAAIGRDEGLFTSAMTRVNPGLPAP